MLSIRCQITPASRRTLKWCVHVDLVTGSSKLLHVRSRPGSSDSSATIRSRIGSLSACRTAVSSSSSRGGCAIRAKTVDELIHSFTQAWASPEVGVVALTGSGDRAFCTGGDQKQRMETGDYGPSASGLFEIERLHRLVRDIPKPVIAAVNGYAIGGGHVLHVLCDITIAVDEAQFGQVGPRVGSFDAGFGTAYLARILGEKRAR